MAKTRRPRPLTKHDQFIRSELSAILEPGETVVETGHVFRGPNVILIALLIGPIGLLLLRHYYAVATDRRIILIRTKMGMFSLRRINAGVESIFYSDVRSLRSGGFLNQKSLTLVTASGTRTTLRANSIDKLVAGTSAFFESVEAALEAPAAAVAA